MRFVRSNSTNASNAVESFAVTKHTRKTVDGVCRHHNHSTIFKDENSFPNFSWIRVVGVNG